METTRLSPGLEALRDLVGLLVLLAVLLVVYRMRQGVPFEQILDDPMLLVRSFFASSAA